MGHSSSYQASLGPFDDDDDEEDADTRQLAYAGDDDESVQRKRRHRVGSKPPWLRPSRQEIDGGSHHKQWK